MEKAIVSPPSLQGRITPPGDKSISHRAAIFNSFAIGQATVTNFATGEDCTSTLRCLRKLGVKLTRTSGPAPTIRIQGAGRSGFKEPDDVLNAGNSGTTIRLLTGLLAAQPFFSVVTGDESLRSRPMGRLIKPLTLMGAEIRGRKGDSLAPLSIRGTALHGIDYLLPVASAQLKSAITLAALFASSRTTIEEPALSRDHTERLLKIMGASIDSGGNRLTVHPLQRELQACTMAIPGDISSAAYWLVAASLHPQAELKILSCGVNPTRTGILHVLSNMGANLITSNQSFEGGEPVADISVRSSGLMGITIGGDIIPALIDEIPVLAVAACYAQGTTTIRDAEELRVKESDRIETTAQELTRLGARIETLPDGMIIHGPCKLTGAAVDSHNDHRLAMALAIAGLIASGTTVIQNAEAVDISYPSFWHDLNIITLHSQE